MSIPLLVPNHEHFRYRAWSREAIGAQEFGLAQAATLQAQTPQNELVTIALADFRKFCAECLGVTLPPPVFGDASSDGAAVTFRVREAGASDANPLDPAFESFSLDVSAKGILVEAAHERGLLHATHYLERLMADRGGPFVPYGQRTVAPHFMPRITNSMFVKADQDAGDDSPFDDDYLSLMSHYGANGIHLHMNFWDYCRNGVLPELNSPDFNERIEKLNRLSEKTRKHGIDCWPVLIVRSLEAEHPVFRDPRRRGSPFKIQMADLAEMPVRYVLCSGNPEVLATYEDMMANLFAACPGLPGGIAIVGGEGFLHCYTRPHDKGAAYTSCPHCRDQAPSRPVAELCNRLATGIKKTGRHKAFFAWPYSAFTWSGDDRAQLDWIARLSPDVSVLSNFSTGGSDETHGTGVVLYDYNIMCVKGSPTFLAQAGQLAKAGRRISAKIESNTVADFFSLPYLPVHFRWHELYQSMRRAGVAGFVGQWRFYGMNASLPEDIQYESVWNPESDARDALSRIAKRDFGAKPNAAKRILAAWTKMSEAWDDFPYSAFTAGEREFYMRGPMHLGPSHPLIFNTQDAYRLGPKFRQIRGDLLEGGAPDDYEELVRNAKPRYVSERLLALPYGARRYLDLIGRCRRKWARGVADLKKAMGAQPVERAVQELDICEMTEIHLATLEHVVRFYDLRDRLSQYPTDGAGFAKTMKSLQDVLAAEIANAERSLPILARDPRPGFGYCYGMAYDREMVEDKLRQCRYVRDVELPLFDKTVRFHLWNEF